MVPTKLSPTITKDFYYDSLDRFGYSQRGRDRGALDRRRSDTRRQRQHDAPANYSSMLSYGAFRNRYKQVAVGASGTETTIYVAGLLEKVTNGSGTHYRHYIHGGAGTAAIYSRTVGGSTATFYLHRDHLGSPELITDASGNVLVRASFAAYGERRDGSDWEGAISSADQSTLAGISRRGFTGHEHLDAVGLIHMNGRVFEPIAGRFLSRDPFIDGIARSQGANGYAYVHNSPLSLIDPSGYCGAQAEGMSDEEYQDMMTRCADAYDSQWDAVGSERWCAAMDMGCQQMVLRQRIEEQIYTRTIFNDMLTARVGAPIEGDGILVLGSRTGESDQLSWMRGSASLAGRVDGMVSATLPDGSRGYLATTPVESSSIGTQVALPRPTYQSERGESLQGLVVTTNTFNTLLEFVAAIEKSGAIRLLTRSGIVLGYGDSALSMYRGNYGSALIGAALTTGGVIAFAAGAPVVATAFAAASVTVVLYEMSLGSGDR